MIDPRPAVVGRFAPSPTGAMHLGNARTALLAWLHSRALGGRHLLRFEDLDTGRVRGWAYDVIRRDLDWLGLDWDEEYLQSRRLEVYAGALTRLRTYPCTCTRKEVLAAIAESAGAPHGAEPVYPGTCRQRAAFPARPAAERWRVPEREVCADDALTGQRLCQDLPRDVGDFVLRRGDGAYAYHLAVVADDGAMGVSDVVRGLDLWSATPRQIALQEALGLARPRYLHVPLLRGFQGERLAKRGGAPPLREWREAGTPPERLLADLARSLPWPEFAGLPGEVSARDLLGPWRALWARVGGGAAAAAQP